MTMYLSPVPEIHNLHIGIIPTNRAIKVTKAIREGRVTLLVDDRGNVYSSRAEKVAYTLGSCETQTSTMKALHRLGVITKDQMDAHLAAGERASDRRKRKYAADAIVRDATELGIKLTKAQLAKIEAAKK